VIIQDGKVITADQAKSPSMDDISKPIMLRIFSNIYGINGKEILIELSDDHTHVMVGTGNASNKMATPDDMVVLEDSQINTIIEILKEYQGHAKAIRNGWIACA
jgi:hypothetical protein